MLTKIGVGRSDNLNALMAGAEAAQAALAQAGLTKCDFVFMFATVGYDQARLLAGVRSVTGQTPLCGSSGEGLITQAGPEGETVFTLSGPKKGSDAVGVMAISSDEMAIKNYSETGLNADSRKVGAEIGRKISADTPDDALLLVVFVDRLKVNVKEFFSGLGETLKARIPCCGGLSGDNFILGHNFQYFDDQVMNDSAACALISGSLKIEIGVSHGCLPLGLEKTITRARGKTVYEIDGRPVWDFFKQYLDDKWTKFTREVTTFLDLGIRLPDELATDYDRFIVRAPVSQNPDGSLNFNTEIREGTKVQIIRRDADKISQGARTMAERIKAKLGGREPVAVLHIDCAARGKMFFGEAVKEKGIDVMQDVFGKKVPWLGLFTCGELAPVKGVNYCHNQTAVLCVIYR